ncbi:MAG TPA: hypothetical protein VFR23_24510 [Jiangellaceae bacterium]|nr:hypothetical protein [Jiangellaceae bacterium]
MIKLTFAEATEYADKVNAVAPRTAEVQSTGYGPSVRVRIASAGSSACWYSTVADGELPKPKALIAELKANLSGRVAGTRGAIRSERGAS